MPETQTLYEDDRDLCFGGDPAVLRWGEPPPTRDDALTVLGSHGFEAPSVGDGAGASQTRVVAVVEEPP